MFRLRHIYYIIASICFLLYFEPVWAQNIPLSTEYTRIYDFLDELSTDGVISINHAVRPYTRKAIVDIRSTKRRHPFVCSTKEGLAILFERVCFGT